MLRTALRPRWLALLFVVLLAASGMALLGTWQLDRARANGSSAASETAAAEAAPKPIGAVIKARETFPKDAVGVRVTASGHWDGARRLLVAGRELGGRSGYWVLLPLVLADGSAVPVVRGWIASPDDPSASTAIDQEVTVTGLLQPSEPAQDLAPGRSDGLPDGQIAYVSMPDLLGHWTANPLVTGFVVQQSQAPATGAAPAVVPPPPPHQGYDWRNLSYAVQWWVFAGIGLLFWWRLVRDDHRGLLPTSRADTVTP
ncbi:SURF1 family protein [Spongisporangium articulatum]|uniref:SURF1-like protein n=1 Tax=Spongisporangium articulatum TaxID=3362603 RepID=A0ABW8AP89_9ACTN